MCKYSEIALKTLALKVDENPTCRQFSEKYYDDEIILNKYSNRTTKNLTEKWLLNFEKNSIDGFLCNKDKDFPKINENIAPAEKPYILFYRGNIDLLNNVDKNVAVIGAKNPTKTTIEREVNLVENLVKSNFNIVSGLAFGCDSVAHKTTCDNNGKTVAFLPSTIQKIQPRKNIPLSSKIIDSGGLLVSEYFEEPKNKYETINRYIERDRLQAMFSKCVILIASYLKGVGDSGSRHAMKKSIKYNRERYVMYNKALDEFSDEFGLNKQYLLDGKAKQFKKSSVHEIYEYCISSLNTQMKFDFK